MNETCSDQRGPLPPEGAFVVQFRDATMTGSGMSGRVEHVVSGRAGRFESIEQLLSFVEQTLQGISPGGKPAR